MQDHISLDGKVAWVTGAGRGTGLSIARHLANLGAAVLMQARTPDEVEKAAQQIRDAGCVAEAIVSSVTDPAAANAAVQRALQLWGGLHILVNNAGISPTLERSETLSDDAWSVVLDTNLNGVFYSCRAAAAVMLADGGGSIVNISSVHGSVGHARLAAYAASKGAVELLTKSLAVEWADRGVRVNAVAPGYLATRMTEGLRAHDRLGEGIIRKIPMGRFGEPEDVAGAVAYFASDLSRYATGSVLAVDGGWTAQ